MPRIHSMALVTFVILFNFNLNAKSEVMLSINNLRCNYQETPIEIDDQRPQFSWELISDSKDVMQSAYQILVASSEDNLNSDNGDLWDSGKRMSSNSAGIIYDGNDISSSARYYWKVRIWDSKGNVSDWSKPSYFETALMKDSDWGCGWIGYASGMPGRVIYFKSNFNREKKINWARIYISGLGIYELEINKKKVGDRVLEPAQSSYGKRVYYSTYDVTDELNSAKQNTIVAALAPGWYGTPKLRFVLDVRYEDGTETRLTSNEIRAITTGSVMYSSIFDGERFDAREENPQTYVPGLPAGLMNKVWGLAYNTDEPVGKMASQQVEPIKVVETLSPISIKEPKENIFVVDAGRNLAGWIALKVRNMGSKKVTLRFAETLYDNGLVNQENLRNAKAMDTFIPKNDSAFTFEPKFTYHGFRFVQIEGLSEMPDKEDVKIRVVRSSVDKTGEFHCDNELLNDIQTMVVNTEASNLFSIPTDCPQRDERMGWLNDLTVRIDQAIYNFDLSRFYPKFFWDIVDTQNEDGSITCAAPFRFGNRPADPVCASFLLLAYNCYKFYGNSKLIIDGYDSMKKWTDYLYSRTNNGIVNYSYYGDWCPPRKYLVNEYSGVSRDTPGLMMSTGYLYYCLRLISDMAVIAGHPADKAKYSALATEIGNAFNREYWNEDLGGYAANNQASNSFALFLGLVKPENVKRVAENIEKDVEANGYHLTTGNLCTKYLLEMLTEHGYGETAYKIATQVTYPSWGFMLANGATTLWERWEYLTGDAMNSHNHPMMGSVGSWFYKYVLGINPEFENPAFGHFTIKPYIFNELNHAEGQLKTVKGIIKVSWKKQKKTLLLDVTIPANSKATVYLPSGNGYTSKEVGSGEYHFKTRL